MRTSQRQLSLIDELIDWELLEQQLGHHFSHKAAPPFRLMIGLLYLKTINDLSYEETVKNWGQSPDWQDFCGGLKTKPEHGLRPSTLSIWTREIGDNGIYWMRKAVTLPWSNQTLH